MATTQWDQIPLKINKHDFTIEPSMARPLRGRLLGRMREYTRFHTKNGENRQVIGGYRGEHCR
ncbi:MAG: hypothetical protein DWI02_07580, partial [Planctomycetota bacterium]